MNKKIVAVLLVVALIPIIKKIYGAQDAIRLSKEQLIEIGTKVWRNESNCNPDKLLFWNPKEEFPSFGIGHFIWLPCSCSAKFEQTFPALIDFMRTKKINAPTWVEITHFPWNNREDFLNKKNDRELIELQKLLLETIDVQAEFMIHRLRQTLQNDTIKNNRKLQKQAQLLLQTPRGTFALIDYVNFKGTGLSSEEQYRNQGWGLVQVLEKMNAANSDQAVEQFITSAKNVLTLRVSNSPATKNEAQFLPGWINRVNRY